MDSTWKNLARKHGVTINKDTNTNIIVDDILSWANSLVSALIYTECQLCVCQVQNLSLSLKKLHIFLKQFKFVRIDVCPDGNRPAMSKHQLLQHRPSPTIVRNVAKFVGLMQFFPNFDIQITPLRELLHKENTTMLGCMWNVEAAVACNNMCHIILKDPCLRHYNHGKMLVLCTDFSSATLPASLPRTTPPSKQCPNVCMAGLLIS
jgi:hypothetical protein